MMIRAFAPSAATASDATATSGLGSGLVSDSQSKNRRSYLKLNSVFSLQMSSNYKMQRRFVFAPMALT